MNLILKLILCLIIGACFALWVNLEYNRWMHKEDWKPVDEVIIKPVSVNSEIRVFGLEEK